MIIAFTGPSSLTRDQEFRVVDRMEQYDIWKSEIWRSGCAEGVDTVVARQAILSEVELELYVPSAPHNAELVEELASRARVYQCGGGHDPYRRRNEVMTRGTLGVLRADLLIAFLKSDKFYRSGEWMTVNIARKSDVPIEINLL